MRVLVVDDNDSARRLVIELLSELAPVEVVGEASSGEEALERIDELAPGLVVMDWMMPGLDGVRTTSQLCRAHPDILVVAWTSTDEPAVHELFKTAGAAEVFVKDDVDGLLHAVERLARRPDSERRA